MPPPPVFALDGRVILVTGAGSGLGRAIAEAVGEAGAKVAVADIAIDRIDRATRALGERGIQAMPVHVDVSRAGDVERAVADIVARWGRLDVAFANAGVAGMPVPAHELAEQEWRRVLAVDLDGVFWTSRAALRAMVGQGSGKIVHTASVWGLVGNRDFPVAAYSAAKGGVVNLTRELAAEYGPRGITVNAIAPAFFRTDLSPLARGPEFAARFGPRTLLGRVAEPDEIKGLAVFLASPASDYITGQVIAIDGGYTAT